MKVHVHRRQPDKVASCLRDAGFEVEAQWLLAAGVSPGHGSECAE